MKKKQSKQKMPITSREESSGCHSDNWARPLASGTAKKVPANQGSIFWSKNYFYPSGRIPRFMKPRAIDEAANQ
jgi:hypothetical protein